MTRASGGAAARESAVAPRLFFFALAITAKAKAKARACFKAAALNPLVGLRRI